MSSVEASEACFRYKAKDVFDATACQDTLNEHCSPVINEFSGYLFDNTMQVNDLF